MSSDIGTVPSLFTVEMQKDAAAWDKTAWMCASAFLIATDAALVVSRLISPLDRRVCHLFQDVPAAL